MTDEAQLCTRCFKRYRQSTLRLCRRCEREMGYHMLTEFERDALAVERQQTRKAARARQGPDYQPRPDKFATYDGEDFEIVWDGS